MADNPKVAVACIKWGTPYPASYFNVLRKAVADHLTIPHRFVCVTDDPGGLDPEIEAHDFSGFALPREKWMPGMWGKLALFCPEHFDDDEIVLYLDCDVMVTGDLTPLVQLVEKEGGFHIFREWNRFYWRLLPLSMRPDRGGQSSVFCYRAGDQRHIIEDFFAAPLERIETFGNDQRYLPVVSNNFSYLPYNWAASFKRHCLLHFPLNLLFPKINKPKKAKVLLFHGNPNPHDLIQAPGVRWGTRGKYGYKPVDWVVDYWQKYSR